MNLGGSFNGKVARVLVFFLQSLKKKPQNVGGSLRSFCSQIVHSNFLWHHHGNHDLGARPIMVALTLYFWCHMWSENDFAHFLIIKKAKQRPKWAALPHEFFQDWSLIWSIYIFNTHHGDYCPIVSCLDRPSKLRHCFMVFCLQTTQHKVNQHQPKKLSYPSLFQTPMVLLVGGGWYWTTGHLGVLSKSLTVSNITQNP